MDLFKAILLCTSLIFIAAENQTTNNTECILTDIKSHLSIANQIIETAKEKIPKGKIDAEAGNQTFTDYECAFTEIKSHLRIASQIIETAKQKMPKELKELCKEFKDKECKNVTYNAKPLDCSDIYLSGERRDGLYNIWPRSEMFQGSLRVYCDMESNGGGWTVIQRRGNYGSRVYYFYRDWDDYKVGFGDMMKEFWIGNDNLSALTNQRVYQLRVNLTDFDGDSAYALYDEFSVSDELQDYKLNVSGYSGTAGDSLKKHNGMKFSTRDRMHDLWMYGNCAMQNKGAWWFEECGDSNLNGLYYRTANESIKYDGVLWWTFKNTTRSLKDSVMKIRPTGFTDTSNRTG